MTRRIQIRIIKILLFLAAAASVHGSPVFLRVHAEKDTVGLYDKFESRFALEAVFRNPFDPDEFDVSADFTGPSGKEWKIPCFYNDSGWGMLWAVRFSPNETGRWTYRFLARDTKGETLSDPDTFIVVPSKLHGPVRVSNANGRYLQYADGTPFYGVGFWYNDGYQRFNGGRIQKDELDRLKALGVNFIGTYITPLETMGSGLGRYDQNLCGRLDELLEWCEERDIQLSLNLWFHSFLSETVWPGGNRRWNANPYQWVCQAKDFFGNPEAWRYQEKLYRYMIARWSYSRALAVWFVVDEANGTDGWVSGDSTGAAKWAKKVHDFFKSRDPYGHLTTGTRSGGVNEYWREGYEIFDLAAREIYEAQGFPIPETGKIDAGGPHPLKLSYMNYVNEIRRLWREYPKPVILGETGWDHTFYEPGMPGYLALYHNALWACLCTGTAMTPFWWAYSDLLNDNLITRQLTSLSRFASRIPFSELTQVRPAEARLSEGDVFAMQSDHLIFGWAVNPSADAAGVRVMVSSLPEGEYWVQIYHTWRGQFIHEEKTTCRNGIVEFQIPVLKITDSHANTIGQDAAFILKPVK
jgi:hypothetical protein